MSNPSAFSVPVNLGEQSINLLVYPGQPSEEIKAVLAAAFNADDATVVGLCDLDRDVHYPISLLSRAPEFFSSKLAYGLLLVAGDDDDDDDDEDGGGGEEEVGGRVDEEDPLSLGYVDLFNLGEEQMHELMGLFDAAASNGTIDRPTFEACFEQVLGAAPDEEAAKQMHQVLWKLFDIFDRDDNGIVDALEFKAGLSVLGRGDGDSSVRRAFNSYDMDGNGYVSLDEMVRYLKSVFAVIAQNSPEVFSAHRVSPDELAVATAKSCFAEADLNGDGRLTFDEFKRWYQSSDADTIRQFGDMSASAGAQASEGRLPSLDVLREVTGFGKMNPQALFESFERHARTGVLSQEVFVQCCSKLKPLAAQRDMQRSVQYEWATARLFDLFDADKNGVVDFSELASGLSVLCGGSRDAKVRAVFDLYDFNGDGFISQEEMVKYLTSIFTVVYETSPEARVASRVDAAVLADVTTEECFKSADLNHDGKLSFDEFKAWYSASGQGGEDEEAGDEAGAVAGEGTVFGDSTIEEVCRLTNLRNFYVQDIAKLFDEFAESASLDRETFSYAFRMLRDGTGLDDDEELKVESYVDVLFDAFDGDNNGVVDHMELTSGLSVLCGGSREDRVGAAFALYDINSDGFISLEEMTRYLRSVYRVLYKMKPEIAARMKHVGPEELAIVTAEQAFVDADLDQDGRLSFEEFQSWYLSGDGGANAGAPVNTANKIETIRQLTNLQAYDIRTLLNFFLSRSSDSGHLEPNTFKECFSTLVERNMEGQQGMDIEGTQLDELLCFLFRMFDTDGNGVVDVSELSAGISVLSGGSRDDKVRAAFILFDENGDGFISLSEMIKYLDSVFKMLYESSPGTRDSMQVSPMELATITARQCFEDADKNHDGHISFAEFKEWYSKPTSGLIQTTENSVVTLGEMRRLTNLENYPVDTIFQMFAHCADNNGELSRAAFNGCFGALIGEPESEAHRKRAGAVLGRLFDLFDVDGNGVVSFDELASGLSIMCGGSRDEKVRAAFGLFDLDGNGFIEWEEMVRYLSSVFRILYETTPDTQERLKVTPDELAEVTADEAFCIGTSNELEALTFKQFKQWYTESGQGDAGVDDAPSAVSIEDIQAITTFSEYHVADAVNIISAAADDEGLLDEEAFSNCVLENFFVPTAGGGAKLAHEGYVKAVAAWLFQCFDADHNGFVDSAELISGLTILCVGSRQDKVRAAFSAFDQNGDGFISYAEMTAYLRSVFSLMFAVKPDIQGSVSVSADQLAEVTSQQAFAEADLNYDGKLSYAEFTKWYMATNNSSELLREADGVKDMWTLEEIRSLTGLGEMPVREVFLVFASAADKSGTIDRDSFDECVARLVGAKSNLSAGAIERMADELYDIFDADGNGVVDLIELSSGLSILCGGDRDDKVLAAFSLFDTNGDGYISKKEMALYLSSVFKLIYATKLELQSSLKISAEELGAVTADQAFEDADIDHDGKISYLEFKRWYASGGGAALNQHQGQVSSNMTLSVVREVTGLQDCDVGDVVRLFEGATDNDGCLSRAAFDECFRAILDETGDPTDVKVQMLNSVLGNLFEVFDEDRSGYVDSNELISGLTVLCGGRRDDKVRAAFDKFDTDGDGFISKDEMRSYLRSVFKVLYRTNPGSYEHTGVDADTLAAETADKAFEEADADRDGLLSFEEFTHWYTSSPDEDSEPVAMTHSSPPMSMKRARWLLNLDKHTLHDILDTLVEGAGPQGVLTRDQFVTAMLSLMRLGGNLETRGPAFEEALALIECIYAAFGGGGGGQAVLSQLTSGLSILCSVTFDEKVGFAFALYDMDFDELVSYHELVEYMSSVFKVLFVTSPELSNMMAHELSAESLAHSTATQAFKEAGLRPDSKLNQEAFKAFVRRGLGEMK